MEVGAECLANPPRPNVDLVYEYFSLTGTSWLTFVSLYALVYLAFERLFVIRIPSLLLSLYLVLISDMTGLYKLLMCCLYRLIFSIFLRLRGLRRLEMLLIAILWCSYGPLCVPLLRERLLLRLQMGEISDWWPSNLLRWAAYKILLNAVCIVEPSTQFFSR